MKAVAFAALMGATAAQTNGGSASAVTSTNSPYIPSPAPTPMPTAGCDRPANATLDATIAAFALNLEYLEAEFYSWAAYGHGIPECMGMSTGGQKANLSNSVQAYAEEIALNEMAHVKFLKTVLGDKAPACPQLDIGKAFADAADAALSTKLSPRWNPYSYDQTFLLGAFIFEDVGVTAYNGATPLFTSKVFTGAAASILAIEAYHAATIRTLLTIQRDFPMPPYNGPTNGQVAGAISALRAKVGGGKEVNISTQAYDMSMNYVPPTSIVPADSNALAFGRTVAEVLPIVYLGGTDKGGFFPLGMNPLKA